MGTTSEAATATVPRTTGDERTTLDPWLGRASRALVTSAMVAFAAWTIGYQVALALGIRALPTLGVAIIASVAVLAVLLPGARLQPMGLPRRSEIPGGRAALGALGATAVAIPLALTGHRAYALLLAGLSGLIALVVMVRQPAENAERAPEPGPSASTTTSRWLWPTGWTAAIISAYGSTRIARTDGDDAYFLNLSSWVADRGFFPLNDTMISQNIFPPNGAHSPPTHSVEALIGTLARLTQVEAGSIAYLAVPPALTLLGVLALTWAVEESRIPTSPAAVVAAVGYLWTTGGTGYSFGSFFAVRLWQGKAMLLSLAVPLIIVLGSRLLRSGGWRNHVLFGAAVITAVGFSNTSAFLVPLLLGAMFVAGLALRRPMGSFRVLLWALYPVAGGVVSFLMAPESATDAQLSAEGFATERGPYVNPLVTVPGRDGILVATILAIGLGALGIANRTVRAVAAATIVVTAITLLPPARDVFADVGLGAVVWRLWWLIPVPLLLGGVVGAVAGRIPRHPALVAAPLAFALALVPLVGGRWVGAETDRTRIVSPTAWKVKPGALTTAQYVQQISRPGDTVLVPSSTSSALAALTVDVQPVSARVYYLPTYASAPEAHAGARGRLQHFVDRETPTDASSLVEELALLDVRTACLRSTRDGGIELLEEAGYSIVGTVRNLTCLQR
ncbi:MAG: DUF6077 domain-containing protein [Ornithinibacter sp.]